MGRREARDVRVLVAGATGYAGGHVVRAMHAAGYWVRALARDPARLAPVRALCDDVFVGEATRPETLAGLCDGIDVVFSSLGIRSFRRRPTFWDVDYLANVRLFDRARAAGVRHGIFISVASGDEVRGRVPVAEARERVVDALGRSGMRFSVLRPTGFFNDMADLFAMARRGTVWLVGDGWRRINPIHGADLAAEAARCVDDPARWDRAWSVGGPEILSQREIAALAFEVLGTRSRVRSVPPWALDVAARLVRPVNANLAGLLPAVALFGRRDFVGEPRGTHTLRPFYESLRDQPGVGAPTRLARPSRPR